MRFVNLHISSVRSSISREIGILAGFLVQSREVVARPYYIWSQLTIPLAVSVNI